MTDSPAREQLTTHVHDRDSEGYRYVYAVLSRRAKGVSVGINLNPNNACNYRCIYCQVSGLSRGSAPEIDLERLRVELSALLREIVEGDYLSDRAPAESRVLRDISISGNGEPSSCRQFAEVVDIVGELMGHFDLAGKIRFVLITNGTFLHRDEVRAGMAKMAELGGEVWLKVDGGSQERRKQVNDAVVPEKQILRSALAVPTELELKIQSCFFALDGQAPDDSIVTDYVDLLKRLREEGAAIDGVLLYGIARASSQPEAPRLSALPEDWFTPVAEQVQALGLDVTVSV
jgi:wyosine [tRNA(Phe)-imidazoG37] synthetase (radical SAM superfamily)